LGIYDIRRPGAKENTVHPVGVWIPVTTECFMNILITNDDGYDAEGLVAAYRAIRSLGTVHVVAPITQRSACSHKITLSGPITVRKIGLEALGKEIYAVDGTPADCVRLAAEELIAEPIDLVISGINAGANAGVDTFYSGTIAGAREGAILSIRSIAISQAVRRPTPIDWGRTTEAATLLLEKLAFEELPGPGFLSVNLPARIPENIADNVHRVPVALDPMPMKFARRALDAGSLLEFDYGQNYWHRNTASPTDYSVVRDGGISIAAIPLVGRF
jgi:5'-nucleotidase